MIDGKKDCVVKESKRDNDAPWKQRKIGKTDWLEEEYATEQAMPPKKVSEMSKERAARLQRVRVSRQQRPASETPKERAARLQRVRVSQQQHLTSETPEERVARLQDLHFRRQPELNSAAALFFQPAVHSKMAKFHSELAQLQISKCTTCLEQFPGLKVTTISVNITVNVFVVLEISMFPSCTHQRTT